MKKFRQKALSVALSIAMLLSLVPIFGISAAATDGTWDGTGTEDDPYIIADLADFTKLRDDVNATATISYADTYFRLDTDLSLTSFAVVGNAATKTFNGISTETGIQ
ncbi:MAG: hypothetical protein LBO63_06870 [Oscillospiraceae bacterium]|jgi:hypothetical protein|nr:hypothetical protein [Oscillospiraceae bacterium]